MATSSENQATTSHSASESETLTLKSSDGQEFLVPVSAAVLSVTIKNMVDEGCAAGAIPLTNVESSTLSKIITYLKKHAAAADLSRDELKSFDDEFVSGESVGDLLDAVLAANYLDIRELIELLSLRIADLIKSHSVDQVREVFNIGADEFLPPAEEEQIRKEYEWSFQRLDED